MEAPSVIVYRFKAPVYGEWFGRCVNRLSREAQRVLYLGYTEGRHYVAVSPALLAADLQALLATTFIYASPSIHNMTWDKTLPFTWIYLRPLIWAARP